MMFLNPKKVISQIHLSKGSEVVDFGFGSGAFLEIILREITKKGSLYAYDIDKNFLDKSKNDFKKAGYNNIFFSELDFENKTTDIKDNSIDFVLISSTLFMLQNKKNIIDESYRILKKNARLLIIDWEKSFGNIGPAEEYIFNRKSTLILLKETPFEFLKNIEAGKYHYGLVFIKK